MTFSLIGNGKDFIDIGYARRSEEDEKKQMQSIPKQLDWLANEEKKWGISLKQTWTDSRTGTKPGRPGFGEMIEFIEQAEKPVRIFTWLLSRLARNPIDEGAIKYLIMQGKIAFIITDRKIVDQTTSQILLGVEFGDATQSSIDLSKDVVDGLKLKVKKGYKPGLALLGWLNDHHGLKGEKKVFKDPERFDILRKQGLKIIETKGVYKVSDVHRYLQSIGMKTKRGKDISYSRVHSLYSNTFIMGKFLWGGKWYYSNAPAMFSPTEFDLLQVYLGKPGTIKRKHNHPYGGIFKCGECNCSFTPEPPKIKRQKNGNVHTYHYMRCTKKKAGVKCSQQCIRVESLESQIKDKILSVQVHPQFLEWGIGKIQEQNKENQYRHTTKKKLIQQERNTIEQSIEGLADKYASGKISDEIYQRMIRKYEQNLEALENQEKHQGTTQEAWFKVLQESIELTRCAYAAFETGSPEEKKELLAKLGSNFFIKDREATIGLGEPYLIIQEMRKREKAILRRFELLKKPVFNSQNEPCEALLSIWGWGLEQFRTRYDK